MNTTFMIILLVNNLTLFALGWWLVRQITPPAPNRPRCALCGDLVPDTPDHAIHCTARNLRAGDIPTRALKRAVSPRWHAGGKP